ncbi:MAG TPA: hypothetical protein VJI97_04685 [Candidatus Nanoarchaeia archaeon]|nr:hypothetical protein [Candidatus Nanoarchaeia archaeon]
MVYIRIRVPQEVADAAKGDSQELANLVKEHYQASRSTQTRAMDLNAADNGAIRNQNQWIHYFNGQKKPMVSAPDIYRAGQNGSSALIDSLQEDFDKSWVVSSTGINYNADNLDARIIHNKGSIVVKPTQRKVLVPVYQNTQLGEVLETEEGKKYLKILFDTDDNPDKIGKTLVTLSGKGLDDNYVWTPTQENRASYPERAAVFGIDGGRFHVYGNDRFDDYDSRSRGVSVMSAKPTRKN